MASETNAMSEMILKGLLFLGIFSIAAKDGKHEYIFEIGINLMTVLILVIFVAILAKLVGMKLMIIEEVETK